MCVRVCVRVSARNVISKVTNVTKSYEMARLIERVIFFTSHSAFVGVYFCITFGYFGSLMASIQHV